MSDMGISPEQELSYRRALLFLQLAIGELSDHDPTTAQRLQAFYDDKIAFVFQHHIRSTDYHSLIFGGTARIRGLLTLSHDFFDDAIKFMGPTPPGLGGQTLAGKPAQASIAFEQASPSNTPYQAQGFVQDIDNPARRNPFLPSDWTPIYHPVATPQEPDSHPSRGQSDRSTSRFGAIGQGKPAPKVNRPPEQSNVRQSRDGATGPNSYTDNMWARLENRHLDASMGHLAAERVKTDRDLAMRDLERRLEELRTNPLKDSTNAFNNRPRNGPDFSRAIIQAGEFQHEKVWLDDIKTQSGLSRDLFEENATTSGARRGFVPQISPHHPEHDVPSKSAASTIGGSWAKVAAIPDMPSTRKSSTADVHFANHKPGDSISGNNRARTVSQASAIGNTQPLHLRRLSSGDSGADGADESYESQLRVVWLFNIPPSYTALQVSRHITSGPLFSLTMETDVADHVPDLSACIIFASSTDAKAFLLSQDCSVTFPAAITAAHAEADTKDGDAASSPAPETTQNAGTRNSYARDGAPNATLQLGNPYPAASLHAPIFAAMRDPHRQARRRVKWARARLFHCVPLGTFKRDVLRLVSGAGMGAGAVELWHFYNPGECTVVFASVAIALRVVDVFSLWARGKVPKSGAAGLKRGAGEVEKVRADGRYVGVEVAFCKDFNEAPPGKLVSSYGPGGAVGVAGGVKGYEGAFEGPRVRVDVL